MHPCVLIGNITDTYDFYLGYLIASSSLKRIYNVYITIHFYWMTRGNPDEILINTKQKGFGNACMYNEGRPIHSNL